MSKHVLIESRGCNSKILDSPEIIKTILGDALRSTGNSVSENILHKFRPSGVTGCVLANEAHLTIHSWPEQGYAAVDIYVAQDFDPKKTEQIIKSGFQSQSSETVVIERGPSIKNSFLVNGYRQVNTYSLDLRGEIPDQICVGTSEGRGYGLFSNRAFEIGELVYDTEGVMAEWDAEYTVYHDAGRSVHSADLLGYELTPELIEIWPEQLKGAIREFYKLSDTSPNVLLQHLSGDYEKEVMITGFDGLKNHSSDANTSLHWAEAKLHFDGEIARFSIPTIATKCISKGQELFVDYSETLLDFIPGENWTV